MANIERPYDPGMRGDLTKALSSADRMREIAPEVPRPYGLLENVRINGAHHLTADDIAIHELLVSRAQEVDPSFEAKEYEIALSELRSALGNEMRRRDLEKNFTRLRNTTLSATRGSELAFSGVPMIVGWSECSEGRVTIRYSLPSPVCALMQTMRNGYAYLELHAMSQMRTRFGVMLYRRIAAMVAGSRIRWDIDGRNSVTWDVPPAQMAEWIGYERPPKHTHHLSRSVDKAAADQYVVRGFEISVIPIKAAAPGEPITAWRVTVVKRPPSRHMIKADSMAAEMRTALGGSDDPAYRVDSNVWLKGQTVAREHGLAGVRHKTLFDAWVLALQEALDGKASPENEFERVRGKTLLARMRETSAHDAAWAVVMDEIQSPDLIVRVLEQGGHQLVRAAHEKRKARRKAAAKPNKVVKTAPSPKAAVPSMRTAAAVPALTADAISRSPQFDFAKAAPAKAEFEQLASCLERFIGDRAPDLIKLMDQRGSYPYLKLTDEMLGGPVRRVLNASLEHAGRLNFGDRYALAQRVCNPLLRGRLDILETECDRVIEQLILPTQRLSDIA